MSKLSEEEIMNGIDNLIQFLECIKYAKKVYLPSENKFKEVIDGLLDLYNKEKDKNKLLKSYSTNLPENVDMILLTKNDFERNISTDYISKDKIREVIKDLDEYDINFYDNIQMLKDVTKNTLQELLEDNENHIPRID